MTTARPSPRAKARYYKREGWATTSEPCLIDAGLRQSIDNADACADLSGGQAMTLVALVMAATLAQADIWAGDLGAAKLTAAVVDDFRRPARLADRVHA